MIVVELDPIEVLNVLLLDLTGSSQQLCGQSIVFSESWASTSSALDINLFAEKSVSGIYKSFKNN